GSLRVQLWGADTDVALSGSDDGDWHHYCLTYDGSDWALYFDGTQAATGTEALDTGSDNALRLGQWNSNYYLDGSIDEFYVYASALDAASIQALYDAVTVAPTVTPTAIPSATPAGPSPLPTASFVEIASIGTESTCVSLVECDLLWTYRGDPGACATVSAVVADLEGNVVASDSLDNDGEDVQVVPGDAEVNEYTLTLACDDDATVTDSIDFQ
ncbi:hypothetical protein AURANDRAFT_69385, partial [Aureococcus anophagefferens]